MAKSDSMKKEINKFLYFYRFLATVYMYMKYKKYSYEEFKKLTTEIILTDDYADYNYYAVYLPNRKKSAIYFKHPYNGNYYHIDDCLEVMGNDLNPCHDIYITNVLNEFNKE